LLAGQQRDLWLADDFHLNAGPVVGVYGVGDRAQAQRYAGVAQRALPREPLTALLKAQTAQLKGDDAAARRSFEGMLDNQDTELLGVRGLFLEAKRAGDEAAALVLAQKAVDRNPKLAWGVNALFDLQAREGDWDQALNTLAIARQNGHVDSPTANRRRAVLLTAEARETEHSDPDKALILANEALRLAPSLVPAADIAGRLLASKVAGSKLMIPPAMKLATASSRIASTTY